MNQPLSSVHDFGRRHSAALYHAVVPARVRALLGWYARLTPRQTAGLLMIALLLFPGMPVRAQDDGPAAPTSSGGQVPTAANAAVVGNTGTFTTGVEIDLPPGRVGMAPKLGLGYASGGGNGPLGVGWSVPMTSISRLGARKGVPGQKVDFVNDEFYLSLNGAGGRLLPVGIPGADPNVPLTENCAAQYTLDGVTGDYCVRRYHTEIESWVKAEAYFGRLLPNGSSVYTSNDADLRFWVLTSKTGMIMHLGMGDGSRITEPGTTYRYAWYLDQSKDTHGNTIDYAYTPGAQSKGVLYYDSIRYGGYQPIDYGAANPGYGYRSSYGGVGADLAPHFEIRFALEPRRDVTVGYRGGYAQVQGERYREIYVVPLLGNPGEVLTDYRMEYGQSFKTGRTLLKRVRHYGVSSVSGATVTPGLEYPSASYTYRGEGQLPLGWEDDSNLSYSYARGNYFSKSDTAGTHDWGARLGDVNGDGLPDKVDSFREDVTNIVDNRILLNNGSGYSADLEGVVPATVFAWHEGASSSGQVRDSGSRLFDINGDGLPDKVDYGGLWSSNTAYLGNGQGFSPTSASFVRAIDGYPQGVRLNPGYDNNQNPNGGSFSEDPQTGCNGEQNCDPCPTCDPTVPGWMVISGPGVSSPSTNAPSAVHFQVLNVGDLPGEVPHYGLSLNSAPTQTIAPVRKVRVPGDDQNIAYVYEGLVPGDYTFTMSWFNHVVTKSFTVGSSAAVPVASFDALPAEGMAQSLRYDWKCASGCGAAVEYSYSLGGFQYKPYAASSHVTSLIDAVGSVIWVKARVNGVESAPIVWRCLPRTPLPGPPMVPLFAEYRNQGVGTTLDRGTRMADLNGDGLVDLVVGQWDQYTGGYYRVYLNTPGGYLEAPEWAPGGAVFSKVLHRNQNNSDIQSTVPGGWDLVDVNGDGLADLVASYSSADDGTKNEIHLNNGRGFNADSGLEIGGGAFVNPWTTEVANCDFCRGGGGLQPVAGSANRYKVFDGQRFDDSPPPQGQPGSQEMINWSESPNIDGKTWLQNVGYRYLDVNGDGLPDLVLSRQGYGSNNALTAVYLNTGVGFRSTAAYGVGAASSVPAPFIWINADGIVEPQGLQCDNLRGTGMVDCLKFHGGFLPTYYKNRDEVPDLIVKVDNGFGGWTEVAYKPSTAYLGQLANAESVHSFDPVVSQLVDTLKSCDGRGQCYTSRYQYAGAYYDWRRHEQRGYRIVRQWEANANPANATAYVDTYYRQDWPFAGMVEKTEARSADGTQVLARSFSQYAQSELPSLLQFTPRKLVLKTADRGDTWDRDLPATIGSLQQGDYHYKFSTATRYAYDAFGSAVMMHAYGLVTPTYPTPAAGEDPFAWTDASPDDDSVTVTQYRYQGDEPQMTSGPWRVGFVKSAQTRKTEPSGYGEPTSFPDAPTLTASRFCYDRSACPPIAFNNPTYFIKAGDLTQTRTWLDKPSMDGNGAIWGSRWIGGDSYYNAYGQVVTARSPKGTLTNYEYSAINNTLLSSVTNAMGQTVTFGYNEAGLLSYEYDINNVRTNYWYNGLWQLMNIRMMSVFGISPVTSYSYQIDPNAPDPNHQYVQSCKMLTSAAQGGYRTACSRAYFDGMMRTYASVAPAPDPAAFASGQGVWSLTKWDDAGLQVDSYRPFQAAYAGDPPASIPSGQPRTHVEYDLKKRPVRTDYPDGTRSLTARSGLESLAVDGKNHWVLHRVDGRGLLVSVKENDASGATAYAASYETTYGYDPLGRLTTVTDPNGLQVLHDVQYDTLGRKTALVDADAGASTMLYDDNGNLVRSADGAGVVANFTYDALGRPLARSYDLSGATTARHAPPSLAYAYHDDPSDASLFARGRLKSITYTGTAADPSPLTLDDNFLYDPLGRTLSSTRHYSLSGASYSFTTSRSYRADGQVMTLTYPDGYVVANDYDPYNGILTRVRGAMPGGTETIFATYDQFNDVGQFTSGTLADQAVQRRMVYDFATGRPISQVDTSTPQDPNGMVGGAVDSLLLQQHDYADLAACAPTAFAGTLACDPAALHYDAVGNITQVASTVNNQDQSQGFTYDPLNRLVGATGAYGTADYAYAVNGNLVTKDGRSYGYNTNHPHQIASRTQPDGGAPESYVSDVVGNLTAAPGLALEWDAANRPTAIHQTKDGVTRNFAYAYDGAGARVYKQLTGSPAAKDDYQRLYLGNLYEVTIEGAPGNQFITHTKHIFAGSARVATISAQANGVQYAALVNGASEKQLASNYALLAGFSRSAGNPFTGAGRLAALYAGKVFYRQHEAGVHTLFTFALALSIACFAAWLLGRVARRDLARLRVAAPSRVPGWLSGHDLPAWSWTGVRRMLRLLGRSLGGDGGENAGDAPRAAWRRLRLVPFLRRWQVASVAWTTLAGFLLQVVLMTGVTTRSYAQSVASGTSPAGMPLGTRYYLQNHLGSSTLILDETGAVLETAVYKPFGELWEDPNQGSQTRNHRFYFTGGEKEEFDLYQFGARWYSPDIGRFISADSIIPDATDSQQMNAYSYTENNPINLVDPSGHNSQGVLTALSVVGFVLDFVCPPAGAAIGAAVAVYSLGQNANATAIIGAVVAIMGVVAALNGIARSIAAANSNTKANIAAYVEKGNKGTDIALASIGGSGTSGPVDVGDLAAVDDGACHKFDHAKVTGISEEQGRYLRDAFYGTSGEGATPGSLKNYQNRVISDTDGEGLNPLQRAIDKFNKKHQATPMNGYSAPRKFELHVLDESMWDADLKGYRVAMGGGRINIKAPMNTCVAMETMVDDGQAHILVYPTITRYWNKLKSAETVSVNVYGETLKFNNLGTYIDHLYAHELTHAFGMRMEGVAATQKIWDLKESTTERFTTDHFGHGNPGL